MRDLQKRKLIERLVEHTGPFHTKYRLTSKGKALVDYLIVIRKLILAEPKK